jgi:branched-chain amino acid transport system ATP-binding protein
MLTLQKVSGSYGAVEVVREVSFSLASGEVLGLMGRNGAGKTSLLRTVMGLVPRRSGSIRIGEDELMSVPPHRIAARGIAYVPQGRRLFGELTVEENLQMGLLAGKSSLEKRDEALALFPILKERLKQQSGSLSGGEQQMLAVARALCVGPKILLLDEPSEGRVPAIVGRLLDSIVKLKTEGLAVLLVEQQVKLALAFCDRILLMENGSIRHEAAASALSTDPLPLERYIGVHR